ncbi:hypothetical protein FLL45_21035 [Aliikangiella marina]|uniref:Uncharacterized protein n=1 Tax=Aliikangiella marina TaxID=1712262 RepID=A0A545T344_9GAMM|nr:hypothetical protein [Aliikangiella marina]TQV71637.1 hypothetical protein FLL45_21035 [Aliikangiella marina]
MTGFDLYPQAWALYIALGIALLFLVDYKLKTKGFKLRVGVLTLLAVGAFTPQTVTDAESLAPMIITSLLNAEVDGLSAIYKALVTMAIIWGIIFASALAIKYFIDAKRDSSDSSQHENKA